MIKKDIFVLVRYGENLKPHVLDSFATYEAADEAKGAALQTYLEKNITGLNVDIQHSTFYNV